MSEELKPRPECGAAVTLEGGDQRSECIRRWNSLPRRPHWTNEPPTHAEELWSYRAPSGEPVIVHTFRPAPGLPLMAAYLDGRRRPSCDPGYESVADMPGQWAGPIPMPEDAR